MRTEMGLFAVVTLMSAFARADAIYLQGGRVLEGNATVQGDKVSVELESGHVTFASDDVIRIDKATSPLDEARRRERKLAADDVAGTIELAEYCRDHNLPTRERALLERVIAQEPSHAEARRRLGYVREGNAWVLRSEQQRKEQLAQRAQQNEERERRLELEMANLRRERAEAELKRAQAEHTNEREAQTTQVSSSPTPIPITPFNRYWNDGSYNRPAPPVTPSLPPPPPPPQAVTSNSATDDVRSAPSIIGAVLHPRPKGHHAPR